LRKKVFTQVFTFGIFTSLLTWLVITHFRSNFLKILCEFADLEAEKT